MEWKPRPVRVARMLSRSQDVVVVVVWLFLFFCCCCFLGFFMLCTIVVVVFGFWGVWFLRQTQTKPFEPESGPCRLAQNVNILSIFVAWKSQFWFKCKSKLIEIIQIHSVSTLESLTQLIDLKKPKAKLLLMTVLWNSDKLVYR